jgi:hypothetical protein
MNNRVDSCNCPPPHFDEISLFDIWNKLVQYKKVFWGVFFVAFIVGGIAIVFSPPQYTFSQVIEMAASPDGGGKSIAIISAEEATLKLKKVFYPAAVRAYNLQATKKNRLNERDLKIEKIGDKMLLLSMSGALKNPDTDKIILQKTIEGLTDNAQEDVNARIKNLTDLEVGLERRLLEINEFHKIIIENVFIGNNKQTFGAVTMEGKVVAMYLNDQRAAKVDLTNKINVLQEQIAGTHNTKLISGFIVSEKENALSIYVRFVLASMASFFLAFFGVFVVDFVIRVRSYSGVKKT